MRKFRRIDFVAAVLLGVFAAPVPVSAHDILKGTFPSDGSTVTGDIEMVRVEFNEPIDPAMSALE
jgi:methionine-rich copper-binding protein CopC